MVDACHYVFAQIHSLDNTESELQGRLRTGGHEEAPVGVTMWS